MIPVAYSSGRHGGFLALFLYCTAFEAKKRGTLQCK